MHRVRFKKEYKNKVYRLTIEKPEEVFLSIYLSDLVFMNTLNDKLKKQFTLYEGRPSKYDIEQLNKIKVVKIECLTPQEAIFKEV